MPTKKKPEALKRLTQVSPQQIQALPQQQPTKKKPEAPKLQIRIPAKQSAAREIKIPTKSTDPFHMPTEQAPQQLLPLFSFQTLNTWLLST